VRERWYQVQPGESGARPAVQGDLVYFGTGDGQVIARDRATGAVRWRSRVEGDAVEGANLVVRGGVVVAPLVRATVGLDARTGRERWRYLAPLDTSIGARGAPGLVVRTRVDADDALAYIAAWGASVSAVDLQTGAVRWTWQPGRSAGDTAAAGLFRSGAMGARVSGDTVFAPVWHFLDWQGLRSEAWLVALDRRTGTELWRVVLPSYTGGVVTEGAPALYRNLVIFTSRGGHAYAIDRTTRQLAWEFRPNTTNATIAQAEVYGDAAYFDGGDHHIYAVRAADGGVLWKAEFPTQAVADLLVTERRVVFTDGAYLYVLDRRTGRRLAALGQPRTDDDSFLAPAAFADGRLFVPVNGAAWCIDEP